MLKSISASCFLAAALAAIPAVSAAASVNFETLKDFELRAADAADQAAFLDANTRSPQLGWESYSTRLEALKDDINDMGRLLALLEERHDSLAPSDREVIDRAAPVLRELADNTTAAIH